MQAPAVAETAVRSVTYLDPTGHVYTADRQMSNRLKDIKGTVAALLDNGNDTSHFFFSSLAEVLQKQYGVSRVILKTKFTSAKPADQELLQEMAREGDFLVAGVCL